MKPRKKSKSNSSEVFTINADMDAGAERGKPVEEPVDTGDGKKERFNISFDLNEDGSPDLSGMRERTKERAQAFFNDPRIAAAFGVKPLAAAEVQIFHPAMVSGFYDMLGALECSILPVLFKRISPIVAKQVFTYSPAEKEALSAPTTRVLNKYAAGWMIKYQDEIALAGILGSLTIQKVQLAIMLSGAGQVKNVESDKKDEVRTPVPN